MRQVLLKVDPSEPQKLELILFKFSIIWVKQLVGDNHNANKHRGEVAICDDLSLEIGVVIGDVLSLKVAILQC